MNSSLKYGLSGIACVALGLLMWTSVASSQTAGPIRGWVWSDNTGWLSLNCLDVDDALCEPSYGLTSNAGGIVSGYAWSEHIGWISAQASDVSGCPAAPCIPKVDAGILTGWMKALSSEDAQSGGWDGWIHLSGAPTHSVSVSPANELSGYGWGSMVIGWLQFEDFTVPPMCTDPPAYFCDGNTSMYRDAWCEVETDEVCEYGCDPATGRCMDGPDLCTDPPGYFCDGNTRKFRDESSCVETTVEVCAYLCDPVLAVCVDPPPITGSMSAVPRLVRYNQRTLITWQTENATSCTVTGNGDSWNDVSGSEMSSRITGPVTYVLYCVGGAGVDPFARTVTVGIVPSFIEI